jgi:PAS domain S-box-containing protein
MEQSSNRVITKVILGQSVGSVRIVTGLFVVCSVIMKILYDRFLPGLIDFDVARWGIIILGFLFFSSTFLGRLSSTLATYLSFFLYSITLTYVVYFALINHFDPNATAVTVLVIGAGTIVINSLSYYGLQSGLIIFVSAVFFFNDELSQENTISFINLIIAIGVFATVIVVRQRLRYSVGLSHSFLEKLQVLSILANKKGEIVFVSSNVRSLLGYERNELLRHGWWKYTNLSKGWITREHIAHYPNIIPKEIATMENSVLTKDGRTVWLNWVNSILPNGNYMGIALDVTKYKQKE